MSDTTIAPTRDEYLLMLIDQGLADAAGRSLLPSDEIVDLLLDLRRVVAEPIAVEV